MPQADAPVQYLVGEPKGGLIGAAIERTVGAAERIALRRDPKISASNFSAVTGAFVREEPLNPIQ
jgi:hypothetical protein